MANGFTSQDICDIIEMCAKSNVNVIKFGDLHVDFGRSAIASQYQAPEKASQVYSVFPAPQNLKDEENVIEDAKATDTASSIEDELATLQVEDPLAYEELLFQGALEDEKDQD